MPPDEVTRPLRGDHARTTEYFGRLATTYGDGRYYGLRRRAVIDAIKPELRAAQSVLDLGCGNGNYLAEFAALGGSQILIGADLTFDMLQQARQRAPKADGLIRADASALPFASRKFDVVFCSHVLPFVADLAVTLAEISRCLRGGGLLIATLPGDNLVRHEIEALLGAERYAEFARLAFQRRSRDRNSTSTASVDRYREAFAGAALLFEERNAAFEITWPDIAEWIRIRWFPVMPPEDRTAVDQMLAAIAARAPSRNVTMVEPFVIGRRAVAAKP